MAATCPRGSWAGWRPRGPTASRSSGRTADASWWRRRRTAGHRCRTACRSGPTPHADEGLTLVETLSVEVAGERTHLDGGTDADLLLVNDDDLTFATVRPDPASLEILLARGGELPSAVGRTLALTTAWSMLYDGELDRRAVHRLRRGRARRTRRLTPSSNPCSAGSSMRRTTGRP